MKRIWLALWLLSQTLGFALPARPNVAGQDLPRRVAWEQNQGGHHGYDTGDQSCVIYAAELPSVTTENLIDRASAVPKSVGYDSCLFSTIRSVGGPRAPPAENFGSLAAKSAPKTTRLGITRNNPADWRATRDLWDNTGYGDILSGANRAAIARGRTPVVDSSWVRNFPEYAGLLGERIPMHHIQGTPITVPLPATRHLDAHMPGGFRYNPGGPDSALPVYPAPNP